MGGFVFLGCAEWPLDPEGVIAGAEGVRLRHGGFLHPW